MKKKTKNEAEEKGNFTEHEDETQKSKQ